MPVKDVPVFPVYSIVSLSHQIRPLESKAAVALTDHDVAAAVASADR
jgi:hypothetical protein